MYSSVGITKQKDGCSWENRAAKTSKHTSGFAWQIIMPFNNWERGGGRVTVMAAGWKKTTKTARATQRRL